jgi:hypothetical protein
MVFSASFNNGQVRRELVSRRQPYVKEDSRSFYTKRTMIIQDLTPRRSLVSGVPAALAY